jgi:hypothetical protein
MSKLISMILTYKEQAREAKIENPHVKNGIIIFKSGMGVFAGGLVIALSIKIPQIKINFNLDTSIGVLITIFGMLVAIIGLVLVCYGLSSVKNTWNGKYFYYLRGLDNQQIDPPFQALPKMASWYRPIPITLSIKNENLETMFNDLQYSMKIIKEKTEQYNSRDIFFSGLAKVPCLFFIGYSFRTGHSNSISLIEHCHKDDSWFRFNQTDEPDIDIIIQPNIFNTNEKFSDIAITIEFTSDIMKQELPIFLQNNIVKIKTTVGYIHNLIRSKMAIERITEKIINQMILLNKKCDRLHIFISAQSSVVFELGRRYQDGMIGNIIVYNYDPIKKGYSWAISLENKEIKLKIFE